MKRKPSANGDEPTTSIVETKEAPAVAILRRYTKPLPVQLTDEERLRIGRDLANACDAISNEDDRQDSIKQELKARMASLEANRTALAALLRRGDEMRDVTVEVVADFAAGMAREIRVDTGEVLVTRELTEKEKQRTLPFDGVADAPRNEHVETPIETPRGTDATGTTASTTTA